MSQPYLGDGGLMDDSIEAKRRRIARACDMCRKKKIKCDGKMPACTHCINYKTECVFTQVEKKRNPPKGAKYIEGLENRLGRMESLLRLSGLLTEDDNGRTDLGTLEKRLADKRESQRASAAPGSNPASPSQASQNEGSGSTPRSTVASPEQSTTNGDKEKRKSGTPEKSEEEVEALSDMMCSLVTNNCGETRYIGSSSGFSIFSPKGISWVNEKTGDSSFQQMISSASVDENKWMYWKPEVFGDLFERRIFRRLPPKNECLSLLKDFFENFNCMFPLFHQPTFMHLVDRQYSQDPYEGSGWWASLNVALALAHRLRVMSNLVPKAEDEKTWGYLKNAIAVVTELTMRNTDLLSVQALLGMGLFLQGTPNPQPSFFLVAAAIRSSHSIGLHKRGSGFNLNPIEIEQRKRVFWIGYMLDKDICLRSGRPPAQDDDDMNVDLPSADSTTGPFDKITKLIQELIERLLQEAADEANHKGWCDKELTEAKEQRGRKVDAIKGLNEKLGSNEALRDKLQEETATLGTEIDELTASLAKMTKERSDESAENEATIKEAEEGKAAVDEALDMLDKFYKTAAKNTVLLESSSSATQVPDMPDAGFDGANKGNQDAA